MKRIISVLALAQLVALNAYAEEPVQSLNKGLVVAVTEPGIAASDTAWLLANQLASPQTVPVLVVLNETTRSNTLSLLKLQEKDLPALVFLDSNGKASNRVLRAAPAEKLTVKPLQSASLN